MTPPERVDVDGAATLLGVTRDTVLRYVRAVPSPLPDPVNGVRGVGSEWLVSELREGQKVRAGIGGRGVSKDRQGTACEDCGNVVERRFRDKKTGALRCKGCDLKAGEAELPG